MPIQGSNEGLIAPHLLLLVERSYRPVAVKKKPALNVPFSSISTMLFPVKTGHLQRQHDYSHLIVGSGPAVKVVGDSLFNRSIDEHLSLDG